MKALTFPFIFLLFLQTAIAWEVCDSCRPKELLEAPGVAFDLTLGYGVSAIHFRNGSTRDLARVKGSPEYISVMQDFAKEAQRARSGLPRERQPLDWEAMKLGEEWDPWLQPRKPGWYEFSDRSQLFLSDLHTKSQIWLEYFNLHSPSQTPPLPQDDRVPILQDMIQQIKDESSILLNLPINTTMLSIPEFFHDLERIDEGSLLEAQRRCDLGRFTYRALLAPDGVRNANEIRTCPDSPNPDECDEVLQYAVIGYDQLSLTVSLNRASTTIAEFLKSTTFLDLGAGAELRQIDEEGYWKDVQRSVEEVLPAEAIQSLSKLVLHGDAATDPSFLRLLKRVFGSNKSLKEDDYLKSPEEHLFIAARGTAMVARAGMETGFIACIPNAWCPRLESDNAHNEL